MTYIWTEDTRAGLHYWNLVNKYFFQNKYVVESKGSNQGILDAVRNLHPQENDRYYLAFDIVYDNMDVMNKYLELRELASAYPEQIVILNMLCFEFVILSFSRLAEWTGTGKADKIAMREVVLSAIKGHKIEIDSITDKKVLEYLKGFKKYSTERVIKAITYELTENDEWSIKGKMLGACWHQDCCVMETAMKRKCSVGKMMSGEAKIRQLLTDGETQRVIQPTESR